jgi:hypothetical protein
MERERNAKAAGTEDTIPEDRFLDLAKKELASRFGPTVYGVELLEEGEFIVLMVTFKDFSFRYCVGKTYGKVVGRWLEIMERVHGAKSMEEIELLLESRGM